MLFVEHGQAPDGGVARWQDRLTPCCKCLGGGCHLNRKIDDPMAGGGFHIERLDTDAFPLDQRPRSATRQRFEIRGWRKPVPNKEPILHPE